MIQPEHEAFYPCCYENKDNCPIHGEKTNPIEHILNDPHYMGEFFTMNKAKAQAILDFVRAKGEGLRKKCIGEHDNCCRIKAIDDLIKSIGGKDA